MCTEQEYFLDCVLVQLDTFSRFGNGHWTLVSSPDFYQRREHCNSWHFHHRFSEPIQLGKHSLIHWFEYVLGKDITNWRKNLLVNVGYRQEFSSILRVYYLYQMSNLANNRERRH